MKSFLKLLFPFVMIGVLSGGCTYARVCSEGGHDICVIANSGWKFIDLIPIASGDIDNPNASGTRIFADTVTLQNNLKILDRYARQRGAVGYRSLTSRTTEEHIFVMLFKRSIYHTSAELVYDAPEGSPQ